MSLSTSRKPLKLKRTPVRTRRGFKSKLADAPREDAGIGNTKLLPDLWERAQAQVISGKATPLKPIQLHLLSGHFTALEIDALVIPKRTLARRKAKHESLTPEETDKALRLARIGAEADRVFGDPAKSARWLRKPSPALSGQTPLELLKSETGALAVGELLGQIDHGMFV